MVRQESLEFNKSAQAERTSIVSEDGKFTASFTSAGRLKVDAELTVKDIQIGAVELKDDVTDRRQNVVDDGTNNAAVITANLLPLPTGAATSTKQLSNDHDVNVSNMIPAVETGLSTSAKQDLLLTELEKKADLTETQPVSNVFNADVKIELNYNTYDELIWIYKTLDGTLYTRNVTDDDYVGGTTVGDITRTKTFFAWS